MKPATITYTDGRTLPFRSAQNVQICTVFVLIGRGPMPAPNGG